MNRFVYDGRHCSDFGIYISGVGTFNSAAVEAERIQIPGRNGDLFIPHGRYSNVVLTYPAFIVTDFAKNTAAARAWLLSRGGYKKLRDDYHPGEYRLAVFLGPLDFDTRFLNLSGETSIYFDCKPQRFLDSGDEVLTYTAAGALYNPTMFTAKPIIDVYCAGSGTVTVGADTMELTNIGSMVTLDCDMQNAYHIAQNLNNRVSGDFPTLAPGYNEIKFTGDVTRVDIRGRWYTL